MRVVEREEKRRVGIVLVGEKVFKMGTALILKDSQTLDFFISPSAIREMDSKIFSSFQSESATQRPRGGARRSCVFAQ